MLIKFSELTIVSRCSDRYRDFKAVTEEHEYF